MFLSKKDAKPLFTYISNVKEIVIIVKYSELCNIYKNAMIDIIDSRLIIKMKKFFC